MTDVSASSPIVVGVDGSPSSEEALDFAIDEAGRRHLPLMLVCAWSVDYAGETLGTLEPHLLEGCRSVVAAAQQRVESRARTVAVTTRVVRSQAAAALIAASADADSVVVGSRGLSPVRAAIVGSTSMQVAEHASAPVVVVRKRSSNTTNSGHRPDVVVGFDGMDQSGAALEYAVTQAAERRRGLTVMHIHDVDFVESTMGLPEPDQGWTAFATEEKAAIAEATAEWRERYPAVEMQTKILRGRVTETLVAASEEAELMVIGSRGRGGFRGLLLGSVSRSVLHRAGCPVAVVRGPRASAVAAS